MSKSKIAKLLKEPETAYFQHRDPVVSRQCRRFWGCFDMRIATEKICLETLYRERTKLRWTYDGYMIFSSVRKSLAVMLSSTRIACLVEDICFKATSTGFSFPGHIFALVNLNLGAWNVCFSTYTREFLDNRREEG